MTVCTLVYTLFPLSSNFTYIFKYTVTHSEVYFCLNLSLLHICNHFLTRSTFFNAKWAWLGPTPWALPVSSTLSNTAEVCSPSLQAMYTTSAPGTQWVYVTIKQL